MPRTRMIKPEFFCDEKTSLLPRDVRLLYIGMWCWSDDYGVIRANEVWLKGNIFPYDEISITNFRKLLSFLENAKRIFKFAHDGENYYYMPYFVEHQVINKPSKSTKNPDFPKDILSTTVALPEHYGSTTVALPSDIDIGVGVGVGVGVGIGIEKHTVCEIYSMLVEKVKNYRPNHKIGNETKDLRTIELMISADKREPGRMKELLAWYPIGEKYIPEVFSAGSFREKYDQLEIAYIKRVGDKKSIVKETASELEECKKNIIRFASGNYGCEKDNSQCRWKYQPECCEAEAVAEIKAEKRIV